MIQVAKLCAKRGVAHVINHAYGIQSRALNIQVPTPKTLSPMPPCVFNCWRATATHLR